MLLSTYAAGRELRLMARHGTAAWRDAAPRRFDPDDIERRHDVSLSCNCDDAPKYSEYSGMGKVRIEFSSLHPRGDSELLGWEN